MNDLLALENALKTAEDRGVDIVFWWRDDDAVSATPALDRLLALSARYHAPLALAVIPAMLEPSLAPSLNEQNDVSVLVHGFSHRNHAPLDAKKAEFGSHRPLSLLAEEAGEALTVLKSAFPDKLVPVFVPPWNRISADLPAALANEGFTGLSIFGERKAVNAAPGLTAINTHIDPINWRGDRSVTDTGVLNDRLCDAIMQRVRGETAEPIGLLTHHLVHDEAIWSFCENLLERLSLARAARFHEIGRYSIGTGLN